MKQGSRLLAMKEAYSNHGQAFILIQIVPVDKSININSKKLSKFIKVEIYIFTLPFLRKIQPFMKYLFVHLEIQQKIFGFLNFLYLPEHSAELAISAMLHRHTIH